MKENLCLFLWGMGDTVTAGMDKAQILNVFLALFFQQVSMTSGGIQWWESPVVVRVKSGITWRNFVYESMGCIIGCWENLHPWKHIIISERPWRTPWKWGPWHLEKSKCCAHLPTKPKWWSGKLQASHPPFGPRKNHGVSPLVRFLGTWRRRGLGTVRMDLPNVNHGQLHCLLRLNDWISGKGETRGWHLGQLEQGFQYGIPQERC